jgi:hypothetical protein
MRRKRKKELIRNICKFKLINGNRDYIIYIIPVVRERVVLYLKMGKCLKVKLLRKMASK